VRPQIDRKIDYVRVAAACSSFPVQGARRSRSIIRDRVCPPNVVVGWPDSRCLGATIKPTGDTGSARLLFLFRFERLLLVELAIALVASRVDLSPVKGILDGAACFVSVRAIGKPAVGDEGPELDEMTSELARDSAPEFELAEARRVHDEAASLELDQLGGRGCVLSLECPVRYLSYFQVKTGLDEVEQRAFAHSALARDGRDAA